MRKARALKVVRMSDVPPPRPLDARDISDLTMIARRLAIWSRMFGDDPATLRDKLGFLAEYARDVVARIDPPLG